MDPRGVSCSEPGARDAGFRVTSIPGKGTLRIEGWGYWDGGVAQAFSREAAGACRAARLPFRAVLDLSTLKPQGQEGQSALRDFMRCLSEAPLSGGTVYAENVLAKMQLTRLLKECGMESVLRFGRSPTDEVT